MNTDKIIPIPMTIWSAATHQQKYIEQSNKLLQLLVDMQLDTAEISRKKLMMPSRREFMLNQIISDKYDEIMDIFRN